MQTKQYKRPIILAIILTMNPIVFMSIAGAAIVITNTDENKSVVLQAIAVTLSIVTGFILVQVLKCKFHEIGFRSLKKDSIKSVLYFIPFIAIEAVSFIAEPITSVSRGRVVILLIFTLLVGLNEELYYRGMLMRVLSQLGVKKAIIISSVLFGLGHAASALGGYAPQYVVLQILFAFLFGFVSAEFLVITKSVWPLIIWHFIHDFIGYLIGDVGETISGISMISLAVQTVILLVTALLYWKKAAGMEAVY